MPAAEEGLELVAAEAAVGVDRVAEAEEHTALVAAWVAEAALRQLWAAAALRAMAALEARRLLHLSSRSSGQRGHRPSVHSSSAMRRTRCEFEMKEIRERVHAQAEREGRDGGDRGQRDSLRATPRRSREQ